MKRFAWAMFGLGILCLSSNAIQKHGGIAEGVMNAIHGAKAKPKPTATLDAGKFVIGDSSKRKLVEADLRGKSAWVLDVARNELFARHGKLFRRKDLQAYFDKQGWYRTIGSKSMDDAVITKRMSRLELDNAEFIRRYQSSHGLTTKVAPSPLPLPAGPTICIDPGHPSEVGAGASGKSISEMRAAWLVSLKLKAVLLKRGYQVVMTKSSEREMVRNKRRAEIANKAQASLLLRIHCDAASETGFSTYYPAKVGSADGIRGPSEQVIKLSKAAAGPFHKAVIKALGGSIGDRGLRTDAQTAVGAKHGGALIGSVYSKVPVLLVEMCVITQAKDETFIKTPKGQQKMAEALAAGVEAAVPVQ